MGSQNTGFDFNGDGCFAEIPANGFALGSPVPRPRNKCAAHITSNLFGIVPVKDDSPPFMKEREIMREVCESVTSQEEKGNTV